jgi:hypothetical protein
MYVRNAGGVSNRPGFVFVATHIFQNDIMLSGGSPGIKTFVFNNQSYDFRKNTGSEYSIYNGNTNFANKVYYEPNGVLNYSQTFLGVEPEEIRYTSLGEIGILMPAVYFGPGPNGAPAGKRNIIMGNLFSPFNTPTSAPRSTGFFFKTLAPTIPSAGTALGYTMTHLPPYLPVSYMLTEVRDSGEEIVVGTLVSGPISNPSNFPSTICHPHDQLQVRVTASILPGANNLVRQFRLYRSAGRDGAFYKFVGATQVSNTATSVGIDDFGGEDASRNPPLDISTRGGESPGATALSNANNAAFYQQRMVFSYGDSDINRIGTITASKLGSPLQIEMPAVFNPIEAFQFRVPVADKSPVVGFLALERLVVLTEKSAYVIRGGEQGELTPTSVNPLLISETGCSKIVEPKVKGLRGIYLSNDHRKIMEVNFGADANLTIKELSILADHLVFEDFHQMEVVSGREDMAFLLRRNGTMVGISLSESPGFFTIETDGHIESIFVKKEKKFYSPMLRKPPLTSPVRTDPDVEVLYAYIIRNGVRNLEKLSFREDVYDEGFIFSDASSIFGHVLSKTDVGFWEELSGSISTPKPPFANIIGGTTWNAGETLIVEINSGPVVTPKIRFDLEINGVVTRYTFTIAGTTAPVTTGFTHAYTGVFDLDLPVELRNVAGQVLPNAVALERVSRWYPLRNSISGLTHLANREVSVFAEGKVYSSPNNPEMPTLTVSAGGVLTLPEYVAWGVVGLPYVSEMETLDLEASDGRTFTDSNKLINAVGIAFTNSRGGYAGIESQGVSNMAPINYKPYEGVSADEKNFEGHVTIPIPAQWSEKGRVNIKQFDPLPLTVLSVYPKGMVGN